ncbi:septum site-determining protein MinC [Siccibacter turicensis]|uniref:septum site-determining protein MinC n=1 Tax=Siccibacter turicensis TaxID=357233 RepID=UPI000465081B|nr:septum site-determining protein MinC [Siccibacter turicensis]
MSNTPIELKGSSFTLSVVHLHDANPEIIRQALEDKIAQAPAFLKNAPVVLNVSQLNGNTNWAQLQHIIAQSGLRVVGISGCKDERLKSDIARAGLPLLSEGKEKAPRTTPADPSDTPPPAAPVATPVTKSRLIDTPIRSGQRIYAPHCDLIVTSHVSAGAELIADGNIHIYGHMRGRALAGASGDKDAQIFCTHLAAELVSIGGEYWLSDQIPAEFNDKAARLKLVDGVLTVEPLY